MEYLLFKHITQHFWHKSVPSQSQDRKGKSYITIKEIIHYKCLHTPIIQALCFRQTFYISDLTTDITPS